MNNRMKALFMVLLLVVITMCFAACGTEDEGVNIDDVTMGGAEDTITVQQYFVSTEYAVMGKDEVNGELMPPVEKQITVPEGENKYIAAIISLKAVPEDNGNYSTIVSDRYTINDISVDDGIAYVDFSSDGLEGGSYDELFLIDQIVYTLSNTFEDVAAVKFTIDGDDADTLMGDVDITDTFVADYL